MILSKSLTKFTLSNPHELKETKCNRTYHCKAGCRITEKLMHKQIKLIQPIAIIITISPGYE